MVEARRRRGAVVGRADAAWAGASGQWQVMAAESQRPMRHIMWFRKELWQIYQRDSQGETINVLSGVGDGLGCVLTQGTIQGRAELC